MKSKTTPLLAFHVGKLFSLPVYCYSAIFPILLSLTAAISSNAQVIWGTTSGGDYGIGSIFRVKADGTDFRKIIFRGGGSNNLGDNYFMRNKGLVRFSNGKFYGITLAGGNYDEGILFEFDPITQRTEEKRSFYFYEGGRSQGDLIEYNGKLYGNTTGMRNTIFSFTPSTNQYKEELRLPSPCAGLTLVNGKFYGLTVNGGLRKAGAIFEFNPHTGEYTVLFQLDPLITGRTPKGMLTHVDGKLYGLTTAGGLYKKGTIIEYDLASQQLEKKLDLTEATSGMTINGDLTYYNGRLLAATYSGGSNNQGELFAYDLTTESLSKVFDFSLEAPSGVIMEENGKLYGTSQTGGEFGKGALFSLNLDTSDYTELYEFNTGSPEGNPFGIPMLDGNELWGMTMTGGVANGGVIFKYDIANDQYQIQHSFNYFPEGKKPSCLVEANGKFYGVTVEGGVYGDGVLFEFNPASFTISVLNNFNCNECEAPYYEVTEGALLVRDNKLYGVTRKNGNPREGILFEYNLETNLYSEIYQFNSDEKGINPIGNLAELNGKIYGTTTMGGASHNGILFEFDPVLSIVQVKLSLNYFATGSHLTLTNSNNSLYGLAYGGSFGRGVLSIYSQEDNTLTKKYEFETIGEGSHPNGSLASKDLKAYGLASGGGSRSNGVIFEYDTQTQLYAKIFVVTDYDHLENIKIVGNRIFGVKARNKIFEFNLDSNVFQELITLNYFNINSGDGINSLIIHGEAETFCSPVAIVSEVIEFNQGRKKNGKLVLADRSIPENALYFGDANDSASPLNGVKFVSLGFGGSIILTFDQPFCNDEGNDLNLVETSSGNASFYDYPEQAEFFVSQDGANWTSLGLTDPLDPEVGCGAKIDKEFDIEASGFDWIKYVKVVDVTDPFAKLRDKNTCAESSTFAFNTAADGFDLDAVERIRTLKPGNDARIKKDNGLTMINIDAEHSTAMVYPNPVSNYLVIDFSEEVEMVIASNELTFEIVDMNGMILMRSVDSIDDTWTIKHDVTLLNTGVYVARVTTGNVRRHYKFLKN